MLILFRKLNQKIMIGNDTTVTVVRITPRYITLTIRDLTRAKNVNVKITEFITHQQFKLRIFGVTLGSVRLGIEAPKEIPVHREEVFNRIQAELSCIN